MLLDRLKEKHIILASGSPRRQELLRELGLDFEIRVNDDLEENYPPELTRHEIPVYLAEMKAKSAGAEIPANVLMITADTIVWHNDRLADKPADREDAIRILKDLSGSMHEVITGVCFIHEKRMRSFHATTRVWFAPLDEDEIRYYVDRYKPFDKAGAYGIQEWIGHIGIEKIEGSYFNVMGLPVQKVYHELKEFIGE